MEDSRGNDAGEVVEGEVEELEVGERGEIREWAGERVVPEDEDAEVVEAGEGIAGEGAAKGGVTEGEADDASAVVAFDPGPEAEVGVRSVEEGVVEVGLGFEGEERDCVVGGGGLRMGGEREEEEE